MWLVAATLDGATQERSGVNAREDVNPLKLVANVCFCAHCAFLNEGLHSFIGFFKALVIPKEFVEKCQNSQSWILWYLKVGIAVLGGRPTSCLALILDWTR